MEGITIQELLNEYGLLVVVIGLASSILCGILKIPIAKKIQSLDITDKQKSDRLRNICTIIVAVFSVAGVVLYRCITAHSFTPFASKDLYVEILSAITFSKLAYALYEGVGSVSLKKWLHALIDKIKGTAKTKSSGEKDEVTDWVEIVQEALLGMHMPLTDSQRAELEEKLKEKQNGTTEQESKDE